MEYVECPKEWERLPGQPSVFLAGGITGCPDWQREVSKSLVLTNYAVLNPRRKNFDISKNTPREQISWEFKYLRKADVVAFWFCEETIQPISLFELGSWMQYKNIIIGVHPEYSRIQDVYVQMELIGYTEIVSSLDSLIAKIISFEKNNGRCLTL